MIEEVNRATLSLPEYEYNNCKEGILRVLLATVPDGRAARLVMLADSGEVSVEHQVMAEALISHWDNTSQAKPIRNLEGARKWTGQHYTCVVTKIRLATCDT